MSRCMRGGCIATVALSLLSMIAGVAEAAPSSVVKNIEDSVVTLSLKDVTIQTVPNMAAAPFVREGFITGTSELVCKDVNGSACKTVRGATLNMWAEVGCPLDISGGMTPSLTPQFDSSIPFQGFLQAVLPPPTPAPSPAPNDITDIALLPTGQINPQVGVNPYPGYIRDVPLGIPVKTPMKAGLEVELPLTISVQNSHFEVDNTENSLGSCGGTVAVRIHAQAIIDTEDSQNAVDIYGDVYTL